MLQGHSALLQGHSVSVNDQLKITNTLCCVDKVAKSLKKSKTLLKDSCTNVKLSQDFCTSGFHYKERWLAETLNCGGLIPSLVIV